MGYGHALRKVEDALKIPFMVRAPMSVKGESGPMSVMGLRPATKQEIENAYNKVDAIRNGKKENIKAEAFKPWYGKVARKYGLNDLILPEKEAEKLFNADLSEHVKYVNQKLINDEIDPDTVPPSIMKALLDLQFNGALKTKNERKHLTDTIKDRDWPQFKIEIQKYPISNGRNAWRPQQADEAVIWDKENYRK